MKKQKVNLIYFILIIGIGLVVVSCSNPVDKNKDFAVQLNGEQWDMDLNVPVGKILEHEAGFSNSYGFSILFPLKQFNRNQIRGFEFYFNPNKINPGKEIVNPAESSNFDLRIEFHPVFGHQLNKGILLIYSSKFDAGYIRVIFDEFNPVIGGRVRGRILEAVLYGFYEQADDLSRIPPSSELKLEIFNFKFDTKFQNSIF